MRVRSGRDSTGTGRPGRHAGTRDSVACAVAASTQPTLAAPTLTTAQALRHPGVRRFLIAEAAIMSGVFLQAAAIGKHVYDVTGRTIDLAWIGLAEFLPAACLVLITGWVADHLPRKLVAVAGVAGEAGCSIVLVVYSLGDPQAVWPFFVLAAVFGSFRAFSTPTIRAMPPMVAPVGSIAKVVTLASVANVSAMIFGPAVSGFLYAVKPWVAYAGAASLMLGGAVLLLAVTYEQPSPPVDPADRPTLRHALEGLRFIRRTPILFAAISLDLFAVLFGGAVALLPAIATDRLGVGNVAYGWLRAAPGIGSAIMGILLAMYPLHRRVGSKLLVCVGIFGVATIVLGITRNFAIAFVALLVLAGADMVSVVVRSTLVPLVTPDPKRGRVLAVEAVFIGASNELGAFESGQVAQWMGVPFAVVGGGFATIAVVVVWAVAFPALRRVDRFEDLEEALVQVESSPGLTPSG